MPIYRLVTPGVAWTPTAAVSASIVWIVPLVLATSAYTWRSSTLAVVVTRLGSTPRAAAIGPSSEDVSRFRPTRLLRSSLSRIAAVWNWFPQGRARRSAARRPGRRVPGYRPSPAGRTRRARARDRDRRRGRRDVVEVVELDHAREEVEGIQVDVGEAAVVGVDLEQVAQLDRAREPAQLKGLGVQGVDQRGAPVGLRDGRRRVQDLEDRGVGGQDLARAGDPEVGLKTPSRLATLMSPPARPFQSSTLRLALLPSSELATASRSGPCDESTRGEPRTGEDRRQGGHGGDVQADRGRGRVDAVA